MAKADKPGFAKDVVMVSKILYSLLFVYVATLFLKNGITTSFKEYAPSRPDEFVKLYLDVGSLLYPKQTL